MQERRLPLVPLLLGHAVFVTLIVLAWQHAVVRTTQGDTAFQVFRWVATPGPVVEAHRYTAIVPQLLVRLGVLLGLRLGALLLLASLAHVLLAYLVFVLCAHRWKAPAAALGSALAAVLCTRLTFYAPVLEANYLLCYPFLFFGFAERRASSGEWGRGSILAGVALLLATDLVHPEGWMLMLFGCAWLGAMGLLPRRIALWSGALTLIWPIIARVALPPTAYEQGQLKEVAAGLSDLAHVGGWASARFLWMHTFTTTFTYLPALVVLLWTAIGWWLLQRRMLAMLTAVGALAFTGVYLVALHGGDSGVMMDRGILPLGTIIALPAAWYATRCAGRARAILLAFLALVLFMKLRDVSFAARSFEARSVALQGLLDEARTSRLRRATVPTDRLRSAQLDAAWALPASSLLLSSIDGRDQGVVLVALDPQEPPPPPGSIVILGIPFPIAPSAQACFEPSQQPYAPLP